MTKSGREIMEIFEAFDLTGTAWSAAQLTGYDAKTVARYVAIREAGGIAGPGRAAAADRCVHAENRGDGRPVQGQVRAGRRHTGRSPRWVTGVGAVDPAGGRGGEGGLAVGTPPALPAVDTFSELKTIINIAVLRVVSRIRGGWR